MNENHLGISQQILISNTGDQVVSSTNRLVQYIASLASTLGALAAGMTLAWTSSAGDDGKNLESLYDIHISKDEFSWISSLVAIGSAVICIPIGILTDMIGRKYSMLLMVVPFTIGWLLIIFAKSVIMFYIGRFITGLSGGAFCVAAPIYTAEIAENEIRGTLGSYFQLLLTTGILLSYILGTFVNMRILSIISALVPLIFFVVFMFMPESPSYYLKKGNEKFALVSVCIFIIMFNMGFGPLPWMMMGEIFAPEVKSVAASSACLFNWILVFIVTKFFSDLSKTIDLDATFWLFAVICLIGTFFVYFIVPSLGR